MTMRTPSIVRLPFLINFIDKIDQKKYKQAIECMDLASMSYDPEAQTSRFSMPEGTALTYRSTWGHSLEGDTEVCDT